MPVTLQYVDQARWEADEQVRIDLVRIMKMRLKGCPPVLPFIEQPGNEQHCAWHNNKFIRCGSHAGRR